jgi:hypothetical protein
MPRPWALGDPLVRQALLGVGAAGWAASMRVRPRCARRNPPLASTTRGSGDLHQNNQPRRTQPSKPTFDVFKLLNKYRAKPNLTNLTNKLVLLQKIGTAALRALA